MLLNYNNGFEIELTPKEALAIVRELEPLHNDYPNFKYGYEEDGVWCEWRDEVGDGLTDFYLNLADSDLEGDEPKKLDILAITRQYASWLSDTTGIVIGIPVMTSHRENVQVLIVYGLEKLQAIKNQFPQLYQWLNEEEYFPQTLEELNVMELELNEAMDRLRFPDQYLDYILDVTEPVLSYYWQFSDLLQ